MRNPQPTPAGPDNGAGGSAGSICDNCGRAISTCCGSSIAKFSLNTAGHGKTLGLVYGEILYTGTVWPAAIFSGDDAADVSGSVCMADRTFTIWAGHR